MQWSRHISQGLAPAVALGIIAASILSAVTTKSAAPPAAAASAVEAQHLFSTGQLTGAGVARTLWTAGEPALRTPVNSAYLEDVDDSQGGVWVETRAVPTVIGSTYGKLVVSREFGPSDEADAEDIIRQPHAHVVSVSMGFHPFNSGERAGVWVRFAPDGSPIDQAELAPMTDRYTGISTAQCSAPAPQERAARS